MDVLEGLLFDYTLRTVALGSAALGAVAGALGTFAVLRRQSLLGDAISHAALPGIALAFLLTGSKAPFVLVLGAALGGWLATLAFLAMIRSRFVRDDGALALILSVFFGIGLVLLTFIQRRPDASQAGLETYLFGQASAMLERDLWMIGLLGSLALAVLFIFWKPFKLLAFDRAYGEVIGFPMGRFDILLTGLLVVAIVIGLQSVGVVLMSALLVAPGAAARQWTNRLGKVVVLAGGFGAFSGLTGSVLSATIPRLPTGPTIVLAAGFVVFLSFLLAPERGLLVRGLRTWKARRKIDLDGVLYALFDLAASHAGGTHAHAEAVLRLMKRGNVHRSLRLLAKAGLVRHESGGEWALTPRGLAEASRRWGGAEP